MAGFPKINDEEVQSIIKNSLAVTKGPGIIARVDEAFQNLVDRRRTWEPLNIDLAAAEHYMFARRLAGLTGDPFSELAPTAYHIKKKVFMWLGILERMQTTKHPVMPPRAKLVKWGQLGARHGISDFASVNHGKPLNWGSCLKVIRKEATRISSGEP